MFFCLGAYVELELQSPDELHRMPTVLLPVRVKMPPDPPAVNFKDVLAVAIACVSNC